MSIRFLRRALVFSLMTVLVSAFVQAQPPAGGGRGGGRGFGGPGGFGGGRGMTMDRARLLGLEQVRTELKIEEAQAATIDAALEAYREERNSSPRPDRDALSKMSEEEQTALREKGQKESEELSKKTDEVLNALMEPEQTKRLDQIALQLKLSTTVVATLKSDDLKTKLTLSDEQIAKLDEAEKAAAAEMTKMFEEMRAAGGAENGGRQGSSEKARMFESHRFTLGATVDCSVRREPDAHCVRTTPSDREDTRCRCIVADPRDDSGGGPVERDLATLENADKPASWP